jgi:hypothetical protein
MRRQRNRPNMGTRIGKTAASAVSGQRCRSKMREHTRDDQGIPQSLGSSGRFMTGDDHTLMGGSAPGGKPASHRDLIFAAMTSWFRSATRNVPCGTGLYACDCLDRVRYAVKQRPTRWALSSGGPRWSGRAPHHNRRPSLPAALEAQSPRLSSTPHPANQRQWRQTRVILVGGATPRWPTRPAPPR